jgi:(S)-2-hydroxyglutarate dehydrogenase
MGEYYQLHSNKNNIIQHSIYPVPDPTLPFLGIHLTKVTDDSVTVGPNSVLGLARERYPKLSFNTQYIASVATHSRF